MHYWRSLMADSTGLLVFIIEDIRLAVDLDQVDRVVRAASLKPIPGAPSNVLGLLNLNGIPVPVLSLRQKLKLEEREMETTDEIIILRRQEALLGLVVDDVEDVTNNRKIEKLPQAAELKHLKGAFSIEEGIVLLHDIEKFLSSEEELALAAALASSEV